jgi:hypothetical protein
MMHLNPPLEHMNFTGNVHDFYILPPFCFSCRLVQRRKCFISCRCSSISINTSVFAPVNGYGVALGRAACTAGLR